ncbi:maltose ABC transporter substrate-binding protein [Candidatus Acetothermia bacterium]|nr:maltose ABC transporter substrate-binding protein [Candidatus Acetothermia bacterium]
MKKFITLLLSFILLVGITGTVGASVPGVLTIWADEVRAQILEPIAAEFAAAYGIQVIVHEIGFGELKPKFLIATPAGEGPDILIGAHDWVGELAAAGLLAQIHLKPEEKELLSPVGINAFSWGGELFGFPYIMEAVALFYNRALVPVPPTTFEELITIARKLTDPEVGKYGFLWDAANFYFTFPFLSASGGYVFGVDEYGALNPRDIGLANEGAIRGGELILRLVKEGIIFPGVDYGVMAGLFTAGRAAMIINGPWFISDVRAAGIDYGIAKLPTIDNNVMRPFVGVHGFMINSLSRNIIIANYFLRTYVFTKEVQLQIWRADPRIPTFLPAFLSPEVQADPDVKAIGLSAADGIPMPNIPEMGAVWAVMGPALGHIITTELSPAEALTAAVEAIKGLIRY